MNQFSSRKASATAAALSVLSVPALAFGAIASPNQKPPKESPKTGQASNAASMSRTHWAMPENEKNPNGETVLTNWSGGVSDFEKNWTGKGSLAKPQVVPVPGESTQYALEIGEGTGSAVSHPIDLDGPETLSFRLRQDGNIDPSHAKDNVVTLESLGNQGSSQLVAAVRPTTSDWQTYTIRVSAGMKGSGVFAIRKGSPTGRMLIGTITVSPGPTLPNPSLPNPSLASADVSNSSPITLKPSDSATAAAYKAALLQIDQNTHQPSSSLEKLAVAEFTRWGKTLDVPAAELQAPRVANHVNWLSVMTDRWCYSIDCAGNTSFRPVSNYPAIASGFNINDSSTCPTIAKDDLVSTTRRVGAALGLTGLVGSPATAKHEVLFGGPVGGAIGMGGGRYVVRLAPPSGGAFQMMMDKNGTPIRIDSSMKSDRTNTLSMTLFSNFFKAQKCDQLNDFSGPISVASFYSPTEARFREGVASYEGTTFDSPKVGPVNPFDGKTDQATRWAYELWRQTGNIGGIRGNRIDSGWEKSQVSVSNYPLTSFQLVGGNGIGGDMTMPSKFYNIVNSSTVAVFFTHGGTINSHFNLKLSGTGEGQDVGCWFSLGDAQHKLGTGALRHLFLQACGGLSYFGEADPNARVLATHWLSGNVVDGVRTICAYDGNGSSDQRCGAYFFGAYNKGESISQSWLLATMNQNDGLDLMPATLCFGNSLQEAASVLADGRFSTERAGTKFGAASIWRDM